MKVRYTRKALGHLSEIHAYTEQEWPGTAQAVGEILRNAVARLSQHPELGRPGRVAGTRELVIPRLFFIVAYRIEDGHVDVLAILHTAQRWPSSFGS